MEKYLAISIVSNNGFPSVYMVLELMTTTNLGITQNSSFPIPCDVPESIMEIKQFISSNEALLASGTVASVVVTDHSESVVAQTMGENRLTKKMMLLICLR